MCLFPIERCKCIFDLSAICIFIMPYIPLVRWRTFKLNLANTIWWWELGCNEEWTTLSRTIFDWDVKIKSRQDEASYNMWVDFVNYLNKSKMRNHDLKFCPASCGLIAFILVLRFSIKVSNNYGRILILGKSKFEIQLKPI